MNHKDYSILSILNLQVNLQQYNFAFEFVSGAFVGGIKFIVEINDHADKSVQTKTETV